MKKEVCTGYVYYIRLNQGEYLQLRGGFDWGRAGHTGATRFSSRREAWDWARRLRPFGARVCREIG